MAQQCMHGHAADTGRDHWLGLQGKDTVLFQVVEAEENGEVGSELFVRAVEDVFLD